MNFKDDDQAWLYCNEKDRWIFNKLEVSRRLGYRCGPIGIDIKVPGYYIVRPIINILGMGRNAEILYLNEGSTDEIAHPSSFWCEYFSGRHLSVDYENGNQVLCVEGFRESGDPLYKFSKWKRLDEKIPMPDICKDLKGNYKRMNVEFIGGYPIEIHLRGDPNFEGTNYKEIIPIWKNIEIPKGYKFISAKDFKRIGFLVKEE